MTLNILLTDIRLEMILENKLSPQLSQIFFVEPKVVWIKSYVDKFVLEIT